MSGVYYTPDWVIRHMVAATLGRQLSPACLPPRTGCDSAMLGEQGGSLAFPAATKGKMSQSPAWERLRILDPACGCGFFLLGACRYLVEWYRQRGLHDAGHWVARSLHGADVDAEAVLAARRSLWLELVAGGPPESRGRVPASLAGEILTELTGNVRCGDALADSAGAEEPAGFDVVLGNPPYRRELNAKHLLDPLASTSWGRRHRAPRMDLWYYFVHRGLELLRPGGRLSFIVDSYWTASRGAAKLIAAIQESAWVEEIVSLGRASVFAGVSGRHMIFSLVKGPGRPMTTIKRAAAARVGDAEAILTGRLPLQVFQKTTAQLFRAGRIDLEPPAEELLARLARWRPLGKLGRVRQGIVENPADVTAKANRRHGVRWRTGEGVFVLTPAEAAALELPEVESQLLRAYHDLVDLGRYFLADPASRLLIYSTAETCPQIDAFPSLRSHLARFRPIMEDRRETRLERRPWWQLHWPRDETLWRAGKLLCVQMARRPVFVAAKAPVYVPFSVNVFVPHADTREDLDYLAVLLNSRLLWKWFSHHAKRRGVGLEINGHVLAEAPIRTIDFHCHSECHAHQRLVALGREMMQRTGRRRAADAAKNQTVSDHRLAEIDREIDRAVYALYGLTEAEIALVENAELAL